MCCAGEGGGNVKEKPTATKIFQLLNTVLELVGVGDNGPYHIITDFTVDRLFCDEPGTVVNSQGTSHHLSKGYHTIPGGTPWQTADLLFVMAGGICMARSDSQGNRS